MNLETYLKDMQFKVISDNSEGVLKGTVVKLDKAGSSTLKFKIVSHPKNPSIPKSNLPKYLSKFSVGKLVKLKMEDLSAPLIVENMSTDVWPIKMGENKIVDPIFIVDTKSDKYRVYLSDMLTTMAGQFDGIIFALENATNLNACFVPYEAYEDAALKIEVDKESGYSYIESELMYKFIQLYSVGCKYSMIEDAIVSSKIPRSTQYFFKIAGINFGSYNKIPNFKELTFFQIGIPRGVINVTGDMSSLYGEVHKVYAEHVSSARGNATEAEDVKLHRLVMQMFQQNR